MVDVIHLGMIVSAGIIMPKRYHSKTINMVNPEQHWDTDDGLLLQQHRRSAHEGDPSPVPDHDDEDARCEECLHGEPHFGEAPVLMDALGEERKHHQCQIFVLCMLFYWLTPYHSMAKELKKDPQLCGSSLSSVPKSFNYTSPNQLTTRRMSRISPIPTLTFLRSLTGRRMLRR